MSDETTTTTTTTEQPATPAGAQKTETVTKAEEVIPKSRFDEINERMKKAEGLLAEQQKAAEAAEKAKLAEKQEFQKLYETEQAKAVALEKRLTDLQTEQRMDRLKASVEAEARKANFADPADAYRFLSLDDIELDDTGKPKNVVALIKGLVQTRPYLVSTKTPTPGNGANPTPAGVGTVADQTARSQHEKWAHSQF